MDPMNIAADNSLQDLNQIPVEAGRQLVACVRAHRVAFLKHAESALDQASALAAKARTLLKELDPHLRRLRLQASPVSRCLVEATGSLHEIGNALARMNGELRTKVRTHTLFSDLARKEMEELFRLTEGQLRDMVDMLETGNPTLRSHVLNWCNNLSILMSQFTSQHEERLIQGICSEPAAAIFVGLTDGLRDVCYHIKSIVSACPVASSEL